MSRTAEELRAALTKEEREEAELLEVMTEEERQELHLLNAAERAETLDSLKPKHVPSSAALVALTHELFAGRSGVNGSFRGSSILKARRSTNAWRT